MKKIAFILFLLSVLSLTGNSQEPFTITKLDSTIYRVFEAIKTDNGEFIIAGNNRYGQGSNKYMFIAKINEAGEILWKKDYAGSMYWISSLIRKSDGNYFIAMDGENYTGFLLETDSEGDSIWSWSITALGYNRSRLGPIRELPDGTFILAENIYYNDYYPGPIGSNYYHLNSDGSVKLKFDASNIETYDIEVVSGHEFISAETEHQGIVKYNTDGNMLNADTCTEVENHHYGQWAINRLNENRFFASGGIYMSLIVERGFISEFDDDGNFAYCATDTSTEYIEGVVPVSENRLIYHGVNNGLVIGEFSPPDLFFRRLELDNINSWDYTLLVSGEYIYIFSQVDPYPNERAVLVKIPLDSVVSKVKEPNICPVKIYPNPAKDYVIFEKQDANLKNQILTISDAYGREIESLSIKNEKLVWDTRQIKPGVYFYAFESQKSRIGGKILIIK